MKPAVSPFSECWHASLNSAMGMRMHVSSRLLCWSLIALGCGVVAACSSSSGSGVAVLLPTSVIVRPSSFAGSVPCTPAAGGWKTYVATLTDVTDPSRPFALPSSAPVACTMPVYFYFVLPGHSYVANIDAYDRTDIVAYGAPNSGSPHMIDPDTGLDVQPRWRASCPQDWQTSPEAGTQDPVGDAGIADGDASGAPDAAVASIPGAALCERNLEVTPALCSTLTEILPPQPPSISIDLSALRQGLPCGQTPGTIDHFRLIPASSSLGPRDANCDEVVAFTPVTAGLTYRFRVEAYEAAAATARWATNCSAVAKTSLGVTAVCDTLSTDGALTLQIAPLLQAAGHVCAPQDIVSYRAVLTGSTTPLQPSTCQQDVTWSPLAPGGYQLVVEGLDAAENVGFAAFCEASVLPASVTAATCTVQ